MTWETVIGLEVHVELSTATKIFCGCTTEFGGEPNTHCCPICMGMPGTLPVLNKKVLEYALKAGLALNCEITRYNKFDRKNYFYPDLPKAYQISQLYLPFARNGHVDIDTESGKKTIRIHEIHMEEDAGKLIHSETGNETYPDYNRCGVPLIEIVTEPDFGSAKEVVAYLEKLKSTLKYLGVSDCKMQEGSIRCDVNVSVHKIGEPFGTRCEMKNVNSFSAAIRGIEFEANRQIEVLENGGVIEQETRRWDDAKGESILMRTKENANDYRYFPEPDLLTIVVDEDKIAELKNSLPELPNAKLRRYVDEFGISQNDGALIAESVEKAKLFDDAVALNKGTPKGIIKWILGDISKYINETGKSVSDMKITPERLAELVGTIESGKISNASGKIVFETMLTEDKEVSEIIKEKNLSQNSNTDELEALARDVLSQNEKSVTDYKGGKTNALGFLVGQCMKASKGQANPGMMRDIVIKLLSE